MNNSYLTLKDKHEKEFSAFPMVFAFSTEQFNQGMEKLGLKPTDTNKVYKSVAGGFYKKTDAPLLKELLTKHQTDFDTAIAADTTGDGFILDMFNYELANHEYCITMDDSYTLDALGFTADEINKSKRMCNGLALAKREQWDIGDY